MASPGIAVCTLESNVEGPILTMDWPLMWSMIFCMHLIIRGIQCTSTTLLHALKEKEFNATGTLRTNRRGMPSSILELKAALSSGDGLGTTSVTMMMYTLLTGQWLRVACQISYLDTMKERPEDKTSTGVYLNCKCSPSYSCEALQAVYGKSGYFRPANKLSQ